MPATPICLGSESTVVPGSEGIRRPAGYEYWV